MIYKYIKTGFPKKEELETELGIKINRVSTGGIITGYRTVGIRQEPIFFEGIEIEIDGEFTENQIDAIETKLNPEAKIKKLEAEIALLKKNMDTVATATKVEIEKAA
jgi:hypothetical protein